MHFNFGSLSPAAVFSGFVVGQIVSTLWFTVLFGDRWARCYGVPSRQLHTKEVPGYTYGVQAACTVAQSVSLALLQDWLDVRSTSDALTMGAFVAAGFCATNLVPGNGFLGKWEVAKLTVGCQATMIVAMSVALRMVG